MRQLRWSVVGLGALLAVLLGVNPFNAPQGHVLAIAAVLVGVFLLLQFLHLLAVTTGLRVFVILSVIIAGATVAGFVPGFVGYLNANGPDGHRVTNQAAQLETYWKGPALWARVSHREDAQMETARVRCEVRDGDVVVASYGRNVSPQGQRLLAKGETVDRELISMIALNKVAGKPVQCELVDATFYY